MQLDDLSFAYECVYHTSGYTRLQNRTLTKQTRYIGTLQYRSTGSMMLRTAAPMAREATPP